MIGPLAVAAVLLALAGPAASQVLEIDEHGSVVVFNGPTQYLSPDIREGRVIPRAGRRSPSLRTTGRGGASAPRATVVAAIGAAARQQNLDATLITAVARTESGLNSRAVSAKGAVGVMQLMPGTARALGVDPTDPADNVRGGAVDRHNGAPQYQETQGYISAVLERMAQSVVPVAPPPATPHR